MAKTANGAFYGTGRRKSSIARVYVTPGTGVVTVNKRPLDEYFGDETLRTVALEPFVATQTDTVSQELFLRLTLKNIVTS